MFGRDGQINIKDVLSHGDVWSESTGNSRRQTIRALLREYEFSRLCDAGIADGPPLWRWFTDERQPGAGPVHPAEVQLEYIQTLVALRSADAKATLEKLERTELFDQSSRMWRWSDDERDSEVFEPYTQLKYVNVLCALDRKGAASKFLADLRRTPLYDGVHHRWPWFAGQERSAHAAYYFARAHLAYIDALIGLGERNEANDRLGDMLAGPLFDRQKKQLVTCIAGDDHVVDSQRQASDQLDFVSILARLRSVDEAREVMARLMESGLYHRGQWRECIDERDSVVRDCRRTCDQLRYVQALASLSDPGAEEALEGLKNTKLWSGNGWRSSIDGYEGTGSPCRLSADHLRYVALLAAFAPDEAQVAPRGLPIMRY